MGARPIDTDRAAQITIQIHATRSLEIRQHPPVGSHQRVGRAPRGAPIERCTIPAPENRRGDCLGEPEEAGCDRSDNIRALRSSDSRVKRTNSSCSAFTFLYCATLRRRKSNCRRTALSAAVCWRFR